MSARGKAVMASLAHWCYAPVRTSVDNKCYIARCGRNYLYDALSAGTGTDRALETALRQLQSCATRLRMSAYVAQRFRQEADFL